MVRGPSKVRVHLVLELPERNLIVVVAEAGFVIRRSIAIRILSILNLVSPRVRGARYSSTCWLRSAELGGSVSVFAILYTAVENSRITYNCIY